MTINRRQLAITSAFAFGASALLLTQPSSAQSADEAAVSKAVEDLRKAMVAADKVQLAALTADQLSYGHSAGKLETKAQFIDVIASKKTIYKSIALLEPSVSVTGNTAIARHIFTAETEADGKPASARVGVMQVWTKDGSWKLYARQAFRLG